MFQREDGSFLKVISQTTIGSKNVKQTDIHLCIAYTPAHVRVRYFSTKGIFAIQHKYFTLII